MWKYTSTRDCNKFLLSLNLFDCNDTKKYINTLYAISNNVEKNYRIYKIKKRNGKYRTIYEPNPLLKHIQKQILANIFNDRSISKYATAYHKGLSIKVNALPHVKKDVILKLDIKDFFESISFMNVYNSCFQVEYFPKSVGILLTYLCTYDEHLTQGSPTSAYISNLVMKKFDEFVGKYCDEKNISYTRYSDDMTFSGSFDPSELIVLVRRSLYKLGLELNNDKIHIIHKSAAQNVTGIIVNEKAQVSKKYRKKIRQEVYFIKTFGLDSHLTNVSYDMDSITYLNQLYGRILYVLSINNCDKEFTRYKEYVYKLRNSIF